MPSPPLFPFYSPIKRLTNTNVKVYRDLPEILRIRIRTVKIKATGLTFTFRFLIITNKEDDILLGFPHVVMYIYKEAAYIKETTKHKI